MAVFPIFQLPLESTKVRFKEPFGSEALNLKLTGIIPTGIYRGYTPSPQTNFQLFINTDPTSNDSVAVVELATNFNLTVRHAQQVVLDFTGHSVFPVLVVLRADYSITSNPFSGVTDAKVLVVNPALNNADPQSLHDGDIKIARVTGIGGGDTPTITTVVPTDRNDNGGPLIPASQIKVAIAQDVSSGDLLVPAIAPATLATGLIVGFTTTPALSDVIVSASCSWYNNVDAAKSIQLSLSLDGGASVFLGPHHRTDTSSGESMGFLSFTGGFNNVAAGPHTVEVLASIAPTSPVGVIARGLTGNPIFHPMLFPFTVLAQYQG